MKSVATTYPLPMPASRSRGLGSVRATTALLYLVFLFAFFAPNFRGFVGTAGAIAVNGGILLLCFCLGIFARFRVRFVDSTERLLFSLVGLSLAYYLVAVTGATALFSDTIIFRDTFELHKPVLHFASFATAFLVIRDESDVAHLERVLGICFVGILVGATLQALGVSAIGGLYTDSGNFQSRRLTVPFGNPYDFAFGVSFFCYLFLFRFLTERRIWTLVALALALFAIVMSQSRTNFIVLFVSLVVSTPFVLTWVNRRSLSRLKIPHSYLWFGILLLAVFVAGLVTYRIYYEELRYLIGGLERLYNEGEQSSLNTRIEQFGTALETSRQNWLIALFGNGVSKGVTDLLESAYVFFLFRYGMIGMLLIFLLPLATGIGAAAAALTHAEVSGKVVVMAALVWFLSLFVASVGNSFTEMPRLSFLYYFLIGFVIRYGALDRIHRLSEG